MSKYRTERWEISYAKELTYGEAPDGTKTATHQFGVFQEATLPNPSFDHQGYWYQNPAARHYYAAYKGKATSTGSIGNIILLSGAPVFLPIAESIASTGTDTGVGGSTLNGAHAAGLTTLTVVSGTGYADGDYIQVDTGASAEVRQIVSGGGTTSLVVDLPLQFAHLTGAVCNEVGTPFTHTISETIKLPSFRVVCSNYEDVDTAPNKLVRWFAGGKVNSASYHCEEGGMLMMDMSMLFKMPYFKDAATHTTLTPWYDADTAAQTIVNPCREPYYFSQGVIKLKVPVIGIGTEVTLTSIKSFRLDVNNELQPKYYLTTNDEKVPYEIWEGRRTYKLNLQIDLVDMAASWTKDIPFLELLNQGMDTTFKGACIDMKFSKSATDYIQFTTPASGTSTASDQGALVISAPMNVGGTGIITVSMDMMCKDLKIVVVDDLAGDSYPV